MMPQLLGPAFTSPFNLEISLATILLVLVLLTYFTLSFTELATARKLLSRAHIALKFIWTCFFKPHTGDHTHNQQDALESFYAAQANIYDATRAKLLHGRQDMLALAASQLRFQQKQRGGAPLARNKKPVWVDVGGGTGWNIECMQRHLPVADFFHAVYLVDLSPSLCEVARQRFQRLGWGNVRVICEDARAFKLGDYEDGRGDGGGEEKDFFSIGRSAVDDGARGVEVGADLLTMSYSLSMIPEFHPVVDSLASLLAPDGIMGVVDFYVQNRVDFQSRNYVGGVIDRHCMWLSRVFWRTWYAC